MTNIDEAVIARLNLHGNKFEILVDCEKAIEFRTGKCSLDDALVTNDIFKDVKQGERAPENEMKKIFKTEDKKKIAEEIIKKGEIQLTTEHRNKLREEKKALEEELIENKKAADAYHEKFVRVMSKIKKESKGKRPAYASKKKHVSRGRSTFKNEELEKLKQDKLAAALEKQKSGRKLNLYEARLILESSKE